MVTIALSSPDSEKFQWNRNKKVYYLRFVGNVLR